MVKLEKELKFCKKRYSEVQRKYDAKKKAEDIIESGKIKKLNEEIKFCKRRYSELQRKFDKDQSNVKLKSQ